MFPRLIALSLILAAMLGITATSRAQETGSTAMSFATFKPAMWHQYHWTKRADRNRCRPERFDTLSDFTSTVPLSDVRPGWRDDKVRWARAKHQRAQDKPSLCNPWPDWWEQGAMCIHRYEGSWTDPNSPYWGGMQMDLGFQRTYGPEFYKAKGTADHWTIHEQLLASWRAYSGYAGYGPRGWGPWPLTRTYCGI